WRGRAHKQQAFLLGLHHGAYCVGCCWALMLLMFAVGAGSLGWMLVLAAGLAQIGATEPTKRIITGAVIVVAVVLDTYRSHRARKRS
uniref:copper chaperone n=1 Tax=Pseudomonas sp. TaxID=306 RepID=UPI00259101DA